MGLPQTPFPNIVRTPASPVRTAPQPRVRIDSDTQGRRERPELPALPEGVDWTFVAEQEGTMPGAYVPSDNSGPDANSGVTVAHGFDLGGHSADTLRNLGLREELVTTLAPYAGRRGEAAAAYVRRHPLPLNAEVQRELDAYVFPQTYESIAQRYDRDAGTGTTFAELPEEAQTVITSVAHQYGANLRDNTPNFWRYVTTGDWEGAVRELRDFRDAHGPRRRLEARRLQQGINRGALSARQND
jgi:hypothetical protein